MEEAEIKKRAEEFARAEKKRIARELTDTSKYFPEMSPISIFMAGSPGAGKTEFSKRFVEDQEKEERRHVIRIDGDELRKFLPGYTGDNSSLFQGAISILVEKVHDMALDNRQTFLLDGTLSNYDKALQNINRSLEKKRIVFIFYVYQTPEVAWAFTQAREKVEGRNIPKDVFIEQFLNAREVIDLIRKDFGDRVSLFLVKKNFETHAVENIIEVTSDSKGIDNYLGMRYNGDDLEKLL
jgi:UDP-N-acetylglucosamine kinase